MSMEDEIAEFVDSNPEIPNLQSEPEILAYFGSHPGWKSLPHSVLRELTIRMLNRDKRWITFNPSHAFTIVVFATQKCNGLIHNFIPICQDPAKVSKPEEALTLFAMTFDNLAKKFHQEVEQYRNQLPPEQASIALEDAKLYAEAALICDRYYISAFMPAALSWILRERDIDKALDILSEGIKWARDMGAERPHSTSGIDEQFMF